MLENIIKLWGGTEVSAMQVYKDMFDLGSHSIQKKNEPKGQFKANPIAYWKNNNEDKGHFRIMFEDTFEETLHELQEADFSILNGLTYFGKKNKQQHASQMYAMIFDLDGITDIKLDNFLNAAFKLENCYPIPNYIILSGNGIHLYYIFDEPIDLYPNIKLQLKELKYTLTRKIWNPNTSTEKNVQYQGINQGFRVIGGKTKIDGVRVRAFRLNKHPFTIEQLNNCIPKEKQINLKKIYKESKMSLAEAQKKYPQWYNDKVVNKQNKRYWTCKTDLYNWWKQKLETNTTYGHRYFCVMCLAIYGVKSGIPFEQVEKDAYDLIPFMNGINKNEPFTESDVKAALECYDLRYCTFPINDIIRISGIPFEKNKRNYRKQEVHLKIARLTLQVVREEREIKVTGRPNKREIVVEYLQQHPNNSITQIAKALGVSRPTIYKYLNEVQNNE